MTYTNVTALAAAIDLANAAQMPDLSAKLTRMMDVVAKPKAKSDAPTKAQLQNLNLARQVAVFVWAASENDEMITSKLVVTTAGLPEITTTQKAVAVLKIAADNGWIQRQEIKSRVYWTAGDVDPRA